MSDAFIRGLKRSVVRNKKDNDLQLIKGKPKVTKEVPVNFDEDHRMKIVTQTINYINKHKETSSD